MFEILEYSNKIKELYIGKDTINKIIEAYKKSIIENEESSWDFGTLGLLVLFCKLFSTAYIFHSTNKYSYFLIVSNKFAILSLSSYSHIWEKTNNCGHKKMPQEALHLLRQYQFPVTTTGKAVCSIDGFLL